MSVETKKNITVSLPSGNSFDEQERFQKALDTVVSSAAGSLLIDCSNVTQVTSTHVNMLWKARSVCTETGCSLHLTNVTEGMARVLDVLDLTSLFLDRKQDEGRSPCQGGDSTQGKECKTLALNIPLGSQAISSAQLKIKQYLGELNMAKPCIIEVLTLFYETATNVRLHSGLPADAILQVEIKIEGSKIVMTFRDQGRPFDPTAVSISYDPASMMSSYQKRGLGLVMIRRMADCMVYRRTSDDVNLVTIEKVWK